LTKAVIGNIFPINAIFVYRCNLRWRDGLRSFELMSSGNVLKQEIPILSPRGTGP